MELKDFVAESITAIMLGVSEAQEKCKEIPGAEVSPGFSGLRGNGKDNWAESSSGGVIQYLEFDVAVTADSGAKTKAGIGVVAGVFNLGAAGESTSGESSVSRLKFKVPIVMPGHKR